MVYLILSVVSMISFQQMMRYAQHRRGDVMYVAAANYVAAAVISVIVALIVGHTGQAMTPTVIALGLFNGVFYFGHILVILASFRIAGVSITVAIFGSSIIMPVLAAHVLWDDHANIWQWGALALLPIGMFMLRPRESNGIRLTWRADVVLILVFAGGAIIQTIHKAIDFHAATIGSDEAIVRQTYIATLFCAAALTSVIYGIVTHVRAGAASTGIGIVVGAINVLTSVFIMLSLSVMSAAVYFPVSISMVVGLNVVVSWTLWRERITWRQAGGLLVAVAIVILANLGRDAPPTETQPPSPASTELISTDVRTD